VTAGKLSYAAEQVRRYDHDRFLTVLFAPPAARERLFALYAFNIEIAKTAEIVTEPLIGKIRLQWWRDSLDRLYAGETVAHGVTGALGEAIVACRLDRALFDRFIDAREVDLNRIEPPDFPALGTYAENTGAPLLALALQIVRDGGELAAPALEAARRIGMAWALAGLIRAVPFHARQRRLYLPHDYLRDAGVSSSRLFDLRPEPGVTQVIRQIGDRIAPLLQEGRVLTRELPKNLRSPLLLAELAALHLRDLRAAGWNPFVLERRAPRPLIALTLAMRAILKRY
jgi:phytoene synthase